MTIPSEQLTHMYIHPFKHLYKGHLIPTMIGRFSGSWKEGLEFREEEVAAPSRLTCLYLLSYLQVSRILNIITVMSIKNKLETSVSNFVISTHFFYSLSARASVNLLTQLLSEKCSVT